MKNNKKTTVKKTVQTIHLNTYIAHAGVCSRRKAVDLIKEGIVTVNHAVVTDPAYVVRPKDAIRIKNKLIKKEAYVYVILNKPKGVVTTVSDEQGRSTVLDLVAQIKKRLYPVGRLDRETTGVLLLTNDGLLAQKLAHPKHEIKKTYRAVLDRGLLPKDLERLRKGVRLKDGRVKVDRIACVPATACRVVEVSLHSGKYRIIRRLFEHVGYEVATLDRTKYAQLTKSGLRPGQWRHLTAQEVEELKAL